MKYNVSHNLDRVIKDYHLVNISSAESNVEDTELNMPGCQTARLPGPVIKSRMSVQGCDCEWTPWIIIQAFCFWKIKHDQAMQLKFDWWYHHPIPYAMLSYKTETTSSFHFAMVLKARCIKIMIVTDIGGCI